jgi:anti-sigma factor RsiW
VNNPVNHSHPEELLGAYTLDALDDEEASLVEAHLEVCPQCRESVGQLQGVSELLGLSVERHELPPDLKYRLIDSLPPAEVVPAGSHTEIARTDLRTRTTWILPLAAAIVISLFSASLVLNLRVTSRVDRLEQENSTVTAQLSQSMSQTQELEQEYSVLTAQLSQASAEDQQILDTVHQMQAASYLAVHPETQPLVLEPPSGTGSSQGVLLVGDGGQRALLMVSNMEQPPPLRSYQVWLVKRGHRMPVGQIQVDSTGWGTLDLIPPEPLFEFEWVNLTVEDQESLSQEKMVLRSRIPSGSLR